MAVRPVLVSVREPSLYPVVPTVRHADSGEKVESDIPGQFVTLNECGRVALAAPTVCSGVTRVWNVEGSRPRAPVMRSRPVQTSTTANIMVRGNEFFLCHLVFIVQNRVLANDRSAPRGLNREGKSSSTCIDIIMASTNNFDQIT